MPHHTWKPRGPPRRLRQSGCFALANTPRVHGRATQAWLNLLKHLMYRDDKGAGPASAFTTLVVNMRRHHHFIVCVSPAAHRGDAQIMVLVRHACESERLRPRISADRRFRMATPTCRPPSAPGGRGEDHSLHWRWTTGRLATARTCPR